MLEGLGLAQVMEYGPTGAVVIAVLLGWLVPRWTHTQRMADKDATIALLKETLDKRDAQVEKLIEGQETTIHLLEDIKATAAQRQGRPGR